MPLTAEKYQEYKPIASGKARPEGLGPEAIAAIQEAVQEYETQHLQGVYDAGPKLDEPPPVPGELGLVRVLGYGDEPPPSAEQPLRLQPSFSLLPQALSVQPATTHPGGDAAARDEWIRNPTEAAKGKVFVYDVPLQEAKKDLLEHPEKLRALYPDLFEANPNAITAEQIANLTHGDPILDDYQQMTWRDTAEAAAAGGKTAVRYSKMPLLQVGEGGPDVLSTLGLRLEGGVRPYGEGATAFIMGVDNIANLGAGRAATETVNPDLTPLNPLGTESVGGVTADNTKERPAQGEEENPGAYLGGQALGMRSGWGPAEYLFKQAMGVGLGAAKKLGGGLAARLGMGTAAGTAAAAGAQGIQDAIEVGADAIQGDEGGLDPSAIPGRMGRAALGAAPLSLGGAGLQAFSAKKAHDVRWGNRYEGAPGQLEENLGDEMKFRVGRGPHSQPIEDLKVSARKQQKQPGDLLASEIAKPIANVLDQDVKGVFENVKKARDEFVKSPEGAAPLPVRNFLDQAVTELRADMQAAGEKGIPKVVGKHDSGGELLDLFNQQVDRVSLEPVDGAIPLSPEEAEAFLGRDHRRELLRAKPVKAPKGGPQAPFSPADDLPKAPVTMQRPVGVGEPSPPPHLPTVKPGAGDWRSPRPIDAGEPIAPVGQTPVGKFEYYRQPAQGPQSVQPQPLRGNREPALGTRAAPAAEAPSEAAAMSEGSAPAAAKETPSRAPRSAEPREKMPRGKGIADTLRKRGVETVYVVPRSYDAEHTETLLDKIAADQKKSNRDLSKLDKAARVDRDARTLGGEAGAWSRLQNRHSELIEQAKVAEQLGAPDGNAFNVLATYGRGQRGELPRVDVLRDAADRAGVREQLNRIRSLEPYEQLRKQSNFETVARDPNRGKVKATLDAASIRTLPFWRALEGPLGPVGGGSAGRGALFGRDEDEKKRRREQLETKR